MTTLPNMSLILPTRGAPGAGIWHDALDAALGLIDAHDHSPGKGLRINSDAISIDADLTFSSLYAPTNLHRISFASITALSSNNKSLFVSSADQELYWRSNAGANVKLTSGASLNVAAFVGGIGGDYSSVSALVDYDDATDTYRFRQETAASVRQFAKVKFADIQLIEYDAAGDASVPANAITIKSPDALAGAYSLTLPAALPGSTQLMQLSSAGDVSASNTVANAVTLSATLAAAAITASGLVTANAGVTAGANQHVTVSGTGEYKHGDRTETTNAMDGNATAIWVVNTTTHAMEANGASGGASDLEIVLPLLVGDRIKSVSFQLQGNGTADITTTVTFLNSSMSGSSIGSATTNNQPASWSVITIDVTDTTIVANSAVIIGFASNAAGLMVGNISYTFDHP